MRTIAVLVIRAQFPVFSLARLCSPALILLRALSSLAFIVCGRRRFLPGTLGFATDIGVYCTLLGPTAPFDHILILLGVVAVPSPDWSH